MSEPPQPPAGPPGEGPPGGPDWGDMKKKVMAARGPDRLILVAGLLYVIDSFLPWYGVSFGGISVNGNAWRTGGLSWLSVLFAIGALALAVVRTTGMNVNLPAKDGVAYLILGGGAFILVLLRLITETNFTKFGLYIAIILGAVLAYAGWMKFKAESG